MVLQVKSSIQEDYPDARIVCIPTDVTVREDVQKLVDETELHLGEIDIFVNNGM